MKNEMTLAFDSISENEAFARVAVAAFVTQLNPTLEEVADIKTAVSEAVTNAIVHGYRKSRGGSAVMVIECDQEVPKESLAWLERLEGILKVTYCSLVEE